ncbi:dynein intermediate chain 3, ciliary-like [Diachasmimorpha longicaudata]|uniref:dynein intermediate chain 3, ciliary-like n=1 Tax=Diachasmimorpha longicaudata TaxID=58733 RepID=UPI0030B87033
MEIEYVYVKSRSLFGKQCIFDDSGVTIEENIVSDPKMMGRYTHKHPFHTATQNTRQFAVHEVQTMSNPVKDSGMHHTEGGWPKDINMKDEESVARFRRRVEKSDNWPPRMRNLMTIAEKNVLQNSTINIYQQYFDDMVPTELVLPLGLRTVNVYEDPQVLVRPVAHLAWSPDSGKRLAVAYGCREFQRVSPKLNPYSYIWNIENPNKPFMALKAVHPSVTIEFNPRDPSMLISGLMSGQVCNWDIRSGNTPIQISHPQYSHRNPTNCALWINSKTNTEFFSASTGGIIHWWDIRKLRQPTDSLIMDLENPLRGDVVRAIGVSALQFEVTMGTKFMVGMENGVVVSGTRKGKNPAEKLAVRFNCHYGPVVAIDRNPFSTKNFLTIGDWTARVWAEDTREGNLVSTKHHKTSLTGGCWSTSRCSVFYVINDEGVMEVFDILVGLNNPVTTIRLCGDSLKALAPHENGKLVAVGSDKGSVYLVESSEALTTNARNDKLLLTSYFERCSRYEKSIDSRLKEIRLAQRVDYDDEPLPSPSAVKARSNKGGPGRKPDKEKKTDDKSSRADEKERKKVKQKKTKSAWELLEEPELADVEQQYFEAVQQEMEKYAEASEALGEGSEGTISTLTASRDGTSTKRRKHEESKERNSTVRRSQIGQRKKSKNYSIVKVVVPPVKPDVDVEDPGTEDILPPDVIDEEAPDDEEEMQTTIENANEKVLSPRKPSRFGNKPCEDEICDPMICCLGSTVKPGPVYSETTVRTENHKMNAAIVEMLAGLPKNVLPSQLEELSRYTTDEKHKILAVKDAPPSVLSDALKEAKKGVRKGGEMGALRKFERSTSGKFTVVGEKTELTETVIALDENRGTYLRGRELRKSVSSSRKSVNRFTRKNISMRNPCDPNAKSFTSKEIRSIIGVDIELPERPISSTKWTGESSREKIRYPRYSALNVKKLNE